MDNKQTQNPSELSAEQQLDLLVEKFLAEEEPEQVADLADTALQNAGPENTTEDLFASFEGLETPEVDSLPEAFIDPPDLSGEDAPMAPFTPAEDTQDTPAVTELDDQELEAILRAAFAELADDSQKGQNSSSLVEDTMLFEDLSEAARAAEEAAEATEEAESAEEAAAEEEIQEAEAESPAVPRKRRPKNPNTYGFFGIPHMITTVVWLAIIVFIGAGLGRMVWQVAADMLAFGRESQAVTITITAEDDLDSIAQKLQDIGLIRYKGIFKFYVNLAKAEQKIRPGTYNLNTIYDYNALVKKMSGYTNRASTTVMIPEGYTCAQIFKLLEKSGVCSAEKLENAAMNADLSKYWFLEGIDRSTPNCLEGYLFPDTYDFYLDYEPELVLAKLLNNFNVRFSEAMKEKIDELNLTLADMMRRHGLPESYIEANKITVRELVIIASLIEKETSGNEESYAISSVIYNRLTNPGEYPYLNIDAALVYAVGHSPLTNEDKKFDSPYNTYLYKGLVPGPIANPGIASLNAALSPDSTEYYFYALNPSTGVHEFFRNYKEHQAFLDSLRNGG